MKPPSRRPFFTGVLTVSAFFDAHPGNLIVGKRKKNVYAIDIIIDEVDDDLAQALELSVADARGS